MEGAATREFYVGEDVYVVDYWGTNDGTQAFDARAEILSVDNNAKCFMACLYGDSYQRYKFADYGRLIFDTRAEAIEAADKLPKPKTTMYLKIGDRVYKRITEGIGHQYFGNTIDLVVRLNKGNDVPISEIGHTLFYDISEARK